MGEKKREEGTSQSPSPGQQHLGINRALPFSQACNIWRGRKQEIHPHALPTHTLPKAIFVFYIAKLSVRAPGGGGGEGVEAEGFQLDASPYLEMHSHELIKAASKW